MVTTVYIILNRKIELHNSANTKPEGLNSMTVIVSVIILEQGMTV